METKLAYTSSGVEVVTVLDQEGLDKLATWLCREKDYHWHMEQGRTYRVSDDAFERQQKKNGGYCNICKDFAGEMLSKFEIVRKGGGE